MSAPLTAGQRRLWFLTQLDPDSAGYNMPQVTRLRGPLDVPALSAALNDVVRRHDILRTRFPTVDGEPVQEVVDGWRLVVEVLDVRDLAAVRGLVAARTNAPFDLAAAPPVRATVLRLGTDDQVLCLVLHHVLADDWSLGVLFRELSAGYAARRSGAPADLPPLPVQYADHARAETERPADRTYWLNQLVDLRPLDLVTDLPRTANRAGTGAFVVHRLPATVVDDVRSLCRAGRTTPFMTLLAGYLAVLGLYSGQTDICVGSPFSTRDRTELEPLIGFFLTTVVLRGDLSGDPTFRELLARVKATTVGAYSHPTAPLEELASRHRDPSRNPLFDTMFMVHPTQAGELRLAGLVDTPFDTGHRQAKFDLVVEVRTGADGWDVLANYRTDLFEPATVTGLLERFADLLRVAAAAPDERLSTVYSNLVPAPPPTCPATEHSPWPVPAGARSDIAVDAADATLSYADLRDRVGRAARLLRDHGASPGTTVAVCLEPGAQLVVALLAVLAAGAAYVPLDPGYPRQRLSYLLADSGAGLLLTTGPLVDRVEPAGRAVVLVDSPEWTVGPAEAVAEYPPDSLAYVIYTSGSTGTPKAVAVPRAALAARVGWMRTAYRIRPGDRVLQFSSASFDTFGEEVYPTLAGGATVVVPPARAELPDFLATPAGQALTVLDLPTSYWHELVADVANIAWPPGLRLLILGGEQVHADAVRRWFAAFGDRVEVVNTYGPTEATIIATAAWLTAADGVRRPPIGRPIGGTCVHVHHPGGGGPVPPGVPGELLLGGAGLAHGYLGRPELTAERFVEYDGEVRYRTGDRVRQRPDGLLEFLGRLDDQVKVRGFRIEPGEVEAALVTHPGVRQAVVTADGTGRLIAHLVPEPPGPGPAAAELRTYLSERLPPHLRPDAYGTLAALPLTRNGKVNRAALPAPTATAHAGPPVGPRTDAERLVARVWTEVLGVASVGAHDDFFDLGGHSLLATRTVARLRAALGLDVPLRTIFTSTTVADLAEALEDLLLTELEQLDEQEAQRLVDS